MSVQQGNVELVWGVCKWYSEEKGYGWITLPGGECDVFIHGKQLRYCGIHGPIDQGQRVGCQLRSSKKGWYAVNIVLEETKK